MYSIGELNNAGGALPAAVRWVASLLLSNVGTALAVVAVAGLGLLMLQGRLFIRQGAQAVLGCFILFGAPLIAEALIDVTTQTALSLPRQDLSQQPITPIPMPPPANPDPYSGASLPND